MREYTKFYITPKGERAARSGHPWVYAEEITRIEGEYQNGDLVDVVTNKGKYLGTGFVNDHSKIRVRLISTNTNDKFDADFWERRLRYAIDYRRTVMPGADFKCCRLIFGEADHFPGLTVDRFNDILVAQTLSLGIEVRKELIFNLLYKILREQGEEIRGLYERNDVKIRLLEGMEENKGWFAFAEAAEPGEPLTEIVENGIRYNVDVENGQKTGSAKDRNTWLRTQITSVLEQKDQQTVKNLTEEILQKVKAKDASVAIQQTERVYLEQVLEEYTEGKTDHQQTVRQAAEIIERFARRGQTERRSHM